MRRLARPIVVISSVVAILLIITAVFAPYIAPYSPYKISLVERLKPPCWVKGGSTEHILGTDRLGRDLLSRIIYGARASLSVLALAILFSGTIGSAIGITAGYLGGMVDAILMRITDLMLSFPPILLALLLAVIYGPSYFNIILVITLVLWSFYARVARGDTLKVKELEFVALAELAGCSKQKIMRRHILPNVANSLIVLATVQAGSIIIMEASLSFLGVGIPPPAPSWGSILAEGRSYIASAWWISIFPGVAIMFTVFSLNMLGDALAEWLNPRLRLQ